MSLPCLGLLQLCFYRLFLAEETNLFIKTDPNVKNREIVCVLSFKAGQYFVIGERSLLEDLGIKDQQASRACLAWEVQLLLLWFLTFAAAVAEHHSLCDFSELDDSPPRVLNNHCSFENNRDFGRSVLISPIDHWTEGQILHSSGLQELLDSLFLQGVSKEHIFSDKFSHLFLHFLVEPMITSVYPYDREPAPCCI